MNTGSRTKTQKACTSLQNTDSTSFLASFIPFSKFSSRARDQLALSSAKVACAILRPTSHSANKRTAPGGPGHGAGVRDQDRRPQSQAPQPSDHVLILLMAGGCMILSDTFGDNTVCKCNLPLQNHCFRHFFESRRCLRPDFQPSF